MEPKGPEVSKSRMVGTLRLNERGLPRSYDYGSKIIPVSIVDCTPNTGFLPVLSEYATQWSRDIVTNGSAGAGHSLAVPEDGIYDVSLMVTHNVLSQSEEVIWGLQDVGTNWLFYRRFWVLAAIEKPEYWNFAARAKAGDLWWIISAGSFVGSFNFNLMAIPRSL